MSSTRAASPRTVRSSPTDRTRHTTLTGTGTLIRFILRRDRVRIPIWVVGIAVFVLISALSVQELYPTQSDIETYVALMDGNPTLVAVNGPGYGFEDPNLGVLLVNETTVWGAVALSLMSVFLLVRHTRTEEEEERTDLVRSGIVGRHAPLAAALGVVAAVNVVIGVLVLLGVAGLGYELRGAAVFALSLVLTGLVFTGVAALAVQVLTGARAALGVSAGAVGLAYALRAVGDVGDSPVSWLSPINWAHRARPFAGERWWALALSAAVAALLCTTAVRLADRRDLGGGLLPQRLGRAEATGALSSPWGLALRLQRGQVIGWSVGLFLLGAVYGAVGSDIEQMIADNPDFETFIQQSGGASIRDSYISYTLLLGAMISSGFAIASVLRLRSEESAGRAELLVAAPVSRWSWMWSHLSMALIGTVVILAASGLGTGIGLSIAVDDWGELPRLWGASMIHVPAVMILAGLAAVLFGAIPRWSTAAWGGLAVVVLIGLFAELFRLPHWMRMVSPFEHSPGLPAETLRTLPVALLSLIAAGLLVGGTLAFRRRDTAAT